MEDRSAFIFMAVSLIRYIINVQGSTFLGQIPGCLMPSEGVNVLDAFVGRRVG